MMLSDALLIISNIPLIDVVLILVLLDDALRLGENVRRAI